MAWVKTVGLDVGGYIVVQNIASRREEGSNTKCLGKGKLEMILNTKVMGGREEEEAQLRR